MKLRSVLLILLASGTVGALGAVAADAPDSPTPATGAEAGSSTPAAGAKPRSSPSGAAVNPFAGHADAAKAGRQVFLNTGCYNCHGIEAKGGGIAPDLTASKLDEQQMFHTIHDGRPGTLMPSWGKQLSSDEIWQVITYLKSVRQAG